MNKIYPQANTTPISMCFVTISTKAVIYLSIFTEPACRQNCVKSGNLFLLVQHIFTKNEEVSIPKMWLLLDTCSVDSIVIKSGLVSNSPDCTLFKNINVLTNGGSQTFDKLASLKYYHRILIIILPQCQKCYPSITLLQYQECAY